MTNDGWSSFGKVVAVIAGIGAGCGVIYGIGTRVYDSGRSYGEMVASDESNKEIRRVNDKWITELDKVKRSYQLEKDNLAKEGRLIPNESCLRLTGTDEGKHGIKGESFKCGGTDFYVEASKTDYPKTLEKAVMVAGRYRTDIERYGRVSIYQKVDSAFVPYEGKTNQ